MSEPLPAGRFVVLEGIDGAGTTTQTERLARHLATSQREIVRTREPSDGPIGRFLRRILAREVEEVAPEALAMLFAADRRDHLAREIEPAIGRGALVISDRYVWSSLAYQSQRSARDLVERLNDGVRLPDLTILLRVPAEIAEARRARAKRPEELFDAIALQRRIAAAYDALAASPREGERVLLLDGTAAAEAIASAIAAAVASTLA